METVRKGVTLKGIPRAGDVWKFQAELGELLLGDKITLVIPGDQRGSSLIVARKYWYKEDKGKGGLFGIGGSEGKRTYANLTVDLTDQSVETVISVKNDKDAFIQLPTSLPSKPVITDSGMMQLDLKVDSSKVKRPDGYSKNTNPEPNDNISAELTIDRTDP